MQSVLLDSSFLIALSDDTRPEHSFAKEYFFEFLARGVTLHLSTIVVAEYEVRQRVADLGLHNFIVIPFNIDDAFTTARVFEVMHPLRTEGDDRAAVSADAKLIGQCINAGIEFFVTGDTQCCSRLDRLRKASVIKGVPSALNIRLGYDGSWFNGGQHGISGF